MNTDWDVAMIQFSLDNHYVSDIDTLLKKCQKTVQGKAAPEKEAVTLKLIPEDKLPFSLAKRHDGGKQD
ncbi:MAG: hypothetical protein IK089_03825 [Oxalobacter sp.]|nr:hypothetical protein [Oxalobacter sp.]MBR6000366.1 hypothetical protein [Oxalobacter sp.]